MYFECPHTLPNDKGSADILSGENKNNSKFNISIHSFQKKEEISFMKSYDDKIEFTFTDFDLIENLTWVNIIDCLKCVSNTGTFEYWEDILPTKDNNYYCYVSKTVSW